MMTATPIATAAPHRGSPVKPPESSVRRLVLDRAAELGIPLIELSRAIGRNVTYVHTYIYKGTPRRLPEDARAPIAAMLHLPEEALRDRVALGLRFARAVNDRPESLPTRPVNRDAATVPLFYEDQAIHPANALSTLPAMPSKVGAADFALWIKAPHGRVRAGDVVFVQREHPTRLGDLVVVLAGDAVCSIGELTAISASSVTVTGDGAARDFASDGLSVLKIIGVSLP